MNCFLKNNKSLLTSVFGCAIIQQVEEKNLVRKVEGNYEDNKKI